MKTDWASMLMEDTGPPPDGLGTAFWTVPHLPSEVSQRVHVVFEVLSHLPLRQPVVVVSEVGMTHGAQRAAARPHRRRGRRLPRPPLDLRSCRRGPSRAQELPSRGRPGVRGLPRASRRRVPSGCGSRSGRCSRRGEPRPVAYVLFITSPDAETIDHEEVRRLRKSLQLFAELQSDYVVELDGDGIMRFVSPSFCRAVGAAESELLGRPFLSRLPRGGSHRRSRRAGPGPPAAVLRRDAGQPRGRARGPGDVAGRHGGRHRVLGSRPGRPGGRGGPPPGEDRRPGGGTRRREAGAPPGSPPGRDPRPARRRWCPAIAPL